MSAMHWTAPMRPKNLPKRLPDITGLLLQPKYDGWYVVFKDGRAYTRHGEDITHWACFVGRNLPRNAVGEMLHRDGRAKIPGLAHNPDGCECVLFDVPSDEPIETRLGELNHYPHYAGWKCAPTFSVSSWEEANVALQAAHEAGHEGLVLKRRGSPWVSGDSSLWYRFKRAVS